MTGSVKIKRVLQVLNPVVWAMVLSLTGLPSVAQDKYHNQVWTDVSVNLALNQQLSLIPEMGYRTEPAISLHQGYLRVYFCYRPKANLKLSAWAAHFNTTKLGYGRTMEVRTSQFVSVYWPQVAGFKFEHRLGFDQRFFYLPGYALHRQVHRSRIRLGLHTPAFAIFGTARSFYANASFELLKDMNQQELRQWIDHDWIMAVLGYQINPAIKLEANLLLINGLDPMTNDFEREITVYRLRLKYSLQ